MSQFLAWTLVPLGYQKQAMTCMQQALDIAQELAHPFSLAFATNHVAIIHQLCREPHVVREQAAISMHLCQEHGFPLLLGFNMILQGWALMMQGQPAEGLARMHQGLATYRPTGHNVFYPWSLTRLAEAYGHNGQPEDALTVVAEALTIVETTEERMWEAEIHRLKGDLLLQQSSDNHTKAEFSFQKAIAIAQSQSAKSWELRAATSLSRLWKQQGKRDKARELLGDIYGWFTEGFDTADLIDAKALLDELAEGR